jgi:AcrR family transcriptional regulator
MSRARTTAGPASRRRARRGEGEKLREEILDAAERLLVKAGNADDVSIRAIAEAVGVTPPSLYLHFPDKDALIFAVSERRFDEFDATIEAAGATTDDPIESLRRRGRAYVYFGLEHPEAYRVLFMTDKSGPERLEFTESAGARAFQHVVDAVQRGIDARVLQPVDPVLAAMGIWASVHGVTSMLISMPEFPWPEIETFVRHVCDVQLAGMRATPKETKSTKTRGKRS